MAGPLMVIDVVTWSSGMPSKSTSMSRSVSTATPHMPDLAQRARASRSRSPSAWGNRRRSRARSGPCASRYLKRALVCSGVPKPANMRIVHRRPRYIVGWTPRVKGYSPGRPSVAHVAATRHVGRREHVGHLDVAPGGEAGLARGHLRLGARHGAGAPGGRSLADRLELAGGLAVGGVVVGCAASGCAGIGGGGGGGDAADVLGHAQTVAQCPDLSASSSPGRSGWTATHDAP